MSRISDRPNREIKKAVENENKFITKEDYLKRKQYGTYLDNDIYDALNFMSSFEKKSMANIINDALRQYIPEKYFNIKMPE